MTDSAEIDNQRKAWIEQDQKGELTFGDVELEAALAWYNSEYGKDKRPLAMRLEEITDPVARRRMETVVQEVLPGRDLEKSIKDIITATVKVPCDENTLPVFEYIGDNASEVPQHRPLQKDS